MPSARAELAPGYLGNSNIRDGEVPGGSLSSEKGVDKPSLGRSEADYRL